MATRKHIELTTLGEATKLPYDEEVELLVVAHLNGPCSATSSSGSDRAPAAVSAVIDRSGSMQGMKLQLVQQTLQFVVQHLTPRDQLGLVTFNNKAQQAIPLTFMDPAGKSHMDSAIASIKAEGGTNLSEGLFAGIGQLLGQPSFPVHILKQTGPLTDLGEFAFAVELRLPESCANCKITAAHFTLGTQTVDHPPYEFHWPGTAALEIDFTIELSDGSKAEFHQAFTPYSPAHTTINAALIAPRKGTDTSGIATLKTFLMCLARHKRQARAPLPFQEDLASVVHSLLRDTTVHSVWLFTDGLPNAGIRDPELLKSLIKKRAGSCMVFTLGFGTDHDVTLLRTVAEETGAMYFFVEHEAEIPTTFATCLGGLLSVVAQDLCLELHTIPVPLDAAASATAEAAVTKLLTNHPHYLGNSAHAAATVNMRDLYGEEDRDVMAVVRLPRLAAPDPTPRPVLAWELAYFNVLSGQRERVRCELQVARPDGAGLVPEVPPELLDRQRNRITCSEALERARAVADSGSLDAARAVLDDASERITASPSSPQAFCQGLLQDIQSCREQLLTHHQYTTSGQKMLGRYELSHKAQRSCGFAAYSTPMQAAYQLASPCFVSPQTPVLPCQPEQFLYPCGVVPQASAPPAAPPAPFLFGAFQAQNPFTGYGLEAPLDAYQAPQRPPSRSVSPYSPPSPPPASHHSQQGGASVGGASP